ncbi:hypothetical protein VC83_05094 [Pseudogymnoascus destructans]|uniref:Uncharacterized protein n=2 Tax=Pseudogymnoascus destructans TaxID=655981 RepID=L8FZ76_PSED2|nr:uncharacterized protein VC83_05094 [Pseudogymnoascus destructans]ELR05021.1 hypothetical protein GMDG_01592 [Pseudogymnoascus destructans 20631-21]OAF58562.1 hypothetical protein VC83_05094 [Pseudogymnoascus destructans]
MCVKEFIGFNCGHCALPTLRGCPIVSQSPHFPYCRYPAERPIIVTENCPSCARVVWNQRTLANEESHREMHYRLGREGCVFEGEKGGCETRFDIDIERELGGGGRQIQHAGYERMLAPGQMQIMEMPSGNAERSGGGAGATTMGRKVSKKDRRKSSREIEEAIARVEARFAAINMESSRHAAIEDALRSAGHAYGAAPGGPDNDPDLYAQQTLLDRASSLEMETDQQMSNYYHNPRNSSGLGNVYIGHQFGNGAVGHEALPENDSGPQLHEAHLPGERQDWVQNYIGTTKYYPGGEQFRGASWGEMIANVKYDPGSVVPRGPRAKQERSIRFRGAAQQFSSQMLPSNFSDPALGAPTVDGFHGGRSILSEGIGAAARQPEPYAPPADPLTSVNHPVFDGLNEYSPPNRPYRGPAIVNSDMASTGYT